MLEDVSFCAVNEHVAAHPEKKDMSGLLFALCTIKKGKTKEMVLCCSSAKDKVAWCNDIRRSRTTRLLKLQAKESSRKRASVRLFKK